VFLKAVHTSTAILHIVNTALRSLVAMQEPQPAWWQPSETKGSLPFET